jgi:hypothetical protein
MGFAIFLCVKLICGEINEIRENFLIFYFDLKKKITFSYGHQNCLNFQDFFLFLSKAIIIFL